MVWVGGIAKVGELGSVGVTSRLRYVVFCVFEYVELVWGFVVLSVGL